MGDSFTTPHINDGSPIKNKRKMNFRGVTMTTKFTIVCNIGVRMLFNFNLKMGRCYGKYATICYSYVALIGRSK